jgi:nuclear transport factor 2 (NTF2) superfamily protein
MGVDQVTEAQAREMVRNAERDFASGNVESILSGYTDDIVIRFADVPEIRGKAAAEQFLRARFARQRNYRLKKELRIFQGNVIGNYWDGDWEDARTGRKMRGRGTEFWWVVGGKVAIWEATFNSWDAEAGPKPAVL